MRRPPRVTSLISHFWSLVNKNGPVVREEIGPCWDWVGNCWVAEPEKSHAMLPIGKRKELAHRFSYEMANGPVPTGLLVLHSCDRPRCVNPKHLRAGTSQENSRDAVERTFIYRYENQELARAFVELGLTAGEFAKQLGVSSGMVGGWLHRTRRPSQNALKKIERALGVERVAKIVAAIPEFADARRKLTPEQAREIPALFSSGLSQRQIAKRFSVCLMTVNRICRVAGMGGGRRRLTRDQIAQIREMRRAGVKVKEVAAAFGICAGYVTMLTRARRLPEVTSVQTI